MTITCDLDGCLADFNSAYATLLIKLHGNKFPAEFNPQSPPVWDWDAWAGYAATEQKAAWEHITAGKDKFWQNLEPLPHARETLMVLNGRQKRGDAVWFVSHRMGAAAHQQTLEWLYEHGIDYPCLFFAADKIPYLRLLKTNLFIDDKPSTVVAVNKVAKEERWEDFRLFCKATPYNQDMPGQIQRVASVKDALIIAGLWE